MTDLLLSPPIAFLIYLALSGLLTGLGRALADHPTQTDLKTSTYASGEAAPLDSTAVPGYRPFFVIALFFAILHLGVLMLGSGDLTLNPTAYWIASIYLAGLLLALVALILG
jgi:NADH:ubiquinone oxidoreductase subunit 3 (subunit A)